jgi:PadR family transcriptional regulator, regulatory protein PadR
MIRRHQLGEFELTVMLALLRLENNAYGVPISEELHKVTGRQISLGSIYAALERLERKELVISKLGDPTPERGGRAKRYFRVTTKGMRQVRATRAVLLNLWRGIPAFAGEHP